MSDVLHIGEADRRLNLAPERLQTLKREGRNPPATQEFKDHAYSDLKLTLLRAMGVGQHPRWLMGREEQAEATP